MCESVCLCVSLAVSYPETDCSPGIFPITTAVTFIPPRSKLHFQRNCCGFFLFFFFFYKSLEFGFHTLESHIKTTQCRDAVISASISKYGNDYMGTITLYNNEHSYMKQTHTGTKIIF